MTFEAVQFRILDGSKFFVNTVNCKVMPYRNVYGGGDWRCPQQNKFSAQFKSVFNIKTFIWLSSHFLTV